VNNFVFLARAGFYDGLKFPPRGAGLRHPGRRPGWHRRRRPGLHDPRREEQPAPYRWRPRDGEDRVAELGGSQSYITLGPQPSLDANYADFGQVTSGKDVASKIVVGDVIQKLTIEEK
jgi:peptidyl-prolyl cis-trans isomerase B (cyclophilin B)